MTVPIPVFLPPDLVLQRFCAATGTALDTLRGPAVTRDITRLRHEAMWLLRNLTTASLDQVGALFGRTGATANEGIDKVACRIETDPDYRSRMVALMGAGNDQPPSLMPPGPDVHRLIAASILGDLRLSDTEAMRAALTILASGICPEAPHPEFQKGL